MSSRRLRKPTGTSLRLAPKCQIPSVNGALQHSRNAQTITMLHSATGDVHFCMTQLSLKKINKKCLKWCDFFEVESSSQRGGSSPRSPLYLRKHGKGSSERLNARAGRQPGFTLTDLTLRFTTTLTDALPVQERRQRRWAEEGGQRTPGWSAEPRRLHCVDERPG